MSSRHRGGARGPGGVGHDEQAADGAVPARRDHGLAPSLRGGAGALASSPGRARGPARPAGSAGRRRRRGPRRRPRRRRPAWFWNDSTAGSSPHSRASGVARWRWPTGCSEACSSAPDEPQQLTAVARAGGDHGSQLHAARRHRSRLVEHDRVDATGRLEHLRPLDQDAELRSAARADEQRGGRGEAERTRAGDDQDGDRRRECARRRSRRRAARTRAWRRRGPARSARRSPKRDRRDAGSGALPACAALTSRPICARAVSPPTFVARTTMRPPALIAAPTTASPGRFSTGIDSPVSSA